MTIKFEKTRQVLSAFAGLPVFCSLFDRFLTADSSKLQMLPTTSRTPESGLSKLKLLSMAFIAGAECLDDVDKLSVDPGFSSLCSVKPFGAKTMGNFLRGFNSSQCKELNIEGAKAAFKLRSAIDKKPQPIIFDIDSTSNEQYARYMEGVEFNYEGKKCLSTIQVFDELGFQYWNDVRPGATHTSTDSEEIIHRIFTAMPSNLRTLTHLVRADSGYCKTRFMLACTAKNANFLICMRSIMYRPLVPIVAEWKKQNLHDPKRIRYVGDRECEIGSTTYRLKNTPYSFRVVILRALKEDAIGKLLITDEDYDYQGWITNLEAESPAEIISIYRGRGHCENFVRELKNGFDLHHYPCQKLNANKAYGIIAAISHNLIRLVALKDSMMKPKFAKAVRFHFVHIPCMVVRHAGDIIFRLMDYHLKGVMKFLLEVQKTCLASHGGAT